MFPSYESSSAKTRHSHVQRRLVTRTQAKGYESCRINLCKVSDDERENLRQRRRKNKFVQLLAVVAILDSETTVMFAKQAIFDLLLSPFSWPIPFLHHTLRFSVSVSSPLLPLAVENHQKHDIQDDCRKSQSRQCDIHFHGATVLRSKQYLPCKIGFRLHSSLRCKLSPNFMHLSLLL